MSIQLERHNPANQLIGEILISQQWITPTQLQNAVAEQKRTNQRLGEILVRLGHLSEMELNFILSQQKGNTITGEADTVKQRLGDILKKSKRLSPRELGMAVAEQKRTNEKLGEVLLRMGMLDQDELNAVLAWQDDFNQADPMAVRLLLGEILIASKKLSRKQLMDALATQKMTKKQIGQVLLDAGMVSKFDIRNALKIQTKMVAAGLLAMMMAGPLTGCASPTVPMQTKYGTAVDYTKVTKAARSVSFNNQAPYKVASLSGNRQLLSFNDGSRVVGGVPFFKQAADNTCAQATACVVMNYWGVKQDYQQLVDMQNHFNLATHYTKIVEYMNSKGLQAKAMRGGTVPYLKSLVDSGKPPIVLLEFNNDLMQQHYITVVGYNQAKGTIIFHDSIDGPYRQMDEADFTDMWQSKHLANLPILGGSNYQGLIIEASKASN
jgi:hypothetical protein